MVLYRRHIPKGSLPNKTVDVPLIESRILHWLNYRFGLKGYLHWGFNSWTDDPYNAPGQHRGDGWRVYPKKDGLINSLRWEQMRNGIQDYEYLWMLEKIINELLELDKSPKLIVQTNPLEHSTTRPAQRRAASQSKIANDCTVDVYGYAEPGTKIAINGKEVPVEPDGLFVEGAALSNTKYPLDLLT